jgi:hypothetical protein
MSQAARARWSVISASVIGAVALVLAVAPAADAATAGQPVQFSEDGIHWSDSYSGALFGGVLLVPGDSVDRAFYVRNNAGQPAVMRVTLYDVATTDTDLADAMTVTTSTPSIPGSAVPVTAAQPCATLSQGQVLAAGDGIRLDNVVALADLNGTTAQAHSVSFKLAISLSSTDSAAPAPDSCPTDFGGTVIGTTDPGTGTTSHPVYHLGAGGWTPTPATGPTPAPTTGPTAPPEPQPVNPIVGSLAANTVRLFQEDFVLLWLAMVVVGALIFLFVNGRRSRDDDDDAAAYHPYSRQPTTEIGTRR